MFKTSLIAAAALALSACGSAPTRPSPPNAPAVRTQPAPNGPKAVPQRNATHFSAGLRCMDDMLFRFGVRDVSVMIEEMQDPSQRFGTGTRDMMVSAFADMTRRSRGVRLVTFGQDNQNIVQLQQLVDGNSKFKVLPQYDIRGSITQFDEDVNRRQGGIGASLVSAIASPLFGARLNRSSQASVLGFDASVITTADLSLVPGASSKNTVVVTKEETSLGDGLARIQNGSLNFSFAVGRSEGVAQAIRNMVELSSIELTGKLLRLPYWTCLNIDPSDAEVQREMDDWFLSMQDTPELTRYFQEQLRNRKFYDGPTDGKPNPAYGQALSAHARALGLRDDSGPGREHFGAILLRALPSAPSKPFIAAKPERAPAKAPADEAAGKEIKLSLQMAKNKYRKGEAIELTVNAAQPGYVYCFVQSPSNGKIQRIFPNRFMRDPRVEANVPLVLPGTQGFTVAAGAEGAKRQAVGCFATEREIYNELPPTLRWGDFEDVRLGTFEEIRAAFAQVAKGPVSIEGKFIQVSDE